MSSDHGACQHKKPPSMEEIGAFLALCVVHAENGIIAGGAKIDPEFIASKGREYLSALGAEHWLKEYDDNTGGES